MGPIDLGVVVGYFAVVIGFGAWAARHSKGTKDFFLGGQRFAWWMVAFSCVATLVGSYSFVKYSAAGFTHGLSSSQTYLNDWFWMPLWMFGWLPIVYYARITSVPEYFVRRFGPRARLASMALLLVYLVGYIGINFFTIGKALSAIAGWDLLFSAAIAALICGVYTSHGGQTAVIFTDLLQGVILLIAGVLLFVAGLSLVGGLDGFWEGLGSSGQRALPFFNRPPEFNFVGIFWQDGFVGGIAFYFMNQGILLRFLSARSVGDARKAAAFVLLLLMPIAALAVSGAGWIGRAMASQGSLPADADPGAVFVLVAREALVTGVFGFVVAALLAALMSTADTLINAVATIAVVDFWRPLRERAGKTVTERGELFAARTLSAIATVIGLLLVPVFASYDSIYRAHGTFTAAVTPPLATALLLGIVWPRFSGRAALLVMIGGSALIALSFPLPVLVEPFAHGISLEGAKSYSYIRALYGLVICAGLGVVGTIVWPRRESVSGTLLLGPALQKMRAFKGGEPRKGSAPRGRLLVAEEASAGGTVSVHEGAQPSIGLAAADAAALDLSPGDLASVWSTHWLRGGYQALTGRVVLHEREAGRIEVPEDARRRLNMKPGASVFVRRLI